MSRIKLSHDLGDLSETRDKILVMKDKGVLEDSDDDAIEVENVEMAEREKLEANQRRSKHGKRFNPYDDDWESAGQTETMLSKYDDFDEQERFRKQARTVELQIGAEIKTKGSDSSKQERGGYEYNPSEELPSTVRLESVATSTKFRRSQIEADDSTVRVQQDFYTKEEVAGFRKTSGRSSKKSKRRRDDDEEPEDDVQMKTDVTFHHTAEEDVELYAQLSRLRRMEKEKIDLRNEEQLAEVVRSSRDDTSSSAGVADFLSRVAPVQKEEPYRESQRVPEREPQPEQPSNEETEMKAPVASESTTTADVRIDLGLASALQLFASRGELKPKEDRREDEQDAKEAYRQLTQKFNQRRKHQKRYKETKH
jgi:hypothetical protein